MDEVYTAAFDSLNFVFIGIFTLEAILKIIAMGKKYFKDAWNVFDFIVVMVTFIVLIIKYIPSLQLDLST
jgi:urea transporter